MGWEWSVIGTELGSFEQSFKGLNRVLSYYCAIKLKWDENVVGIKSGVSACKVRV